MRTLFSTLSMLFILSVGSVSAQSDKSGVLDQELKRFDAMTHADTGTLRNYLSDDLVYLHSNGLRENKHEHLAAIASGKLIYEKMERSSAEVRRYGKIAIINGSVAVQGKLNGNAFSLKLLYTAVYKQRKAVWQLVNWQSTKL